MFDATQRDAIGSVAEERAVYGPRAPRLLDRVRTELRTRHMSRRTEEAYVFWIRRFILFHGKRHPATLGAPEVTGFLSSLAEVHRVSASTQNQALSALLFLYRRVLGVELPWLDGLVRARRPVHVPVVLSREEVAAVLAELSGPAWTMDDGGAAVRRWAAPARVSAAACEGRGLRSR
jgi:integrase